MTGFLLVVLLALLAGILPLLYRYPIYNDEIVWDFLLGRFGADRGMIPHNVPQCLTDNSINVPWGISYFRIFDSALIDIFENPAYMRLFSILNFFLIILLTWILLSFFSKSIQLSRPKIALLILSAYSLGTLPFVSSMNRPEQNLVLFSLLYFILCELLVKVSSAFGRAIGLIGIASLGVAIFSYHIKGVFFLPLYLFWAFKAYRGVKWKALASLALIIGPFQGLRYFGEMTKCPDYDFYEYIQAYYFMIRPENLIAHFNYFFPLGVKSFLNFFEYFRSVYFSIEPPSGWLPSLYDSFIPIAAIANILISLVIFILGIGLVFWMKSLRFSRHILQENLVPIGFLIGFTGLSFFQIAKGFYEISYLAPLFFVALLPKIFGRVQNIVLKLLPIAAIFSLITCQIIYRPFIPYWKSGFGRSGKLETVSYYNYSETREKVARLAKQCNLDLDSSLSHFLFDASTYPLIGSFEQPYFLPYLTNFYSSRIPDLKAFLESRNTQGALGHCSNFGEILLPLTKEIDGYCCLSSFKRME